MTHKLFFGSVAMTVVLALALVGWSGAAKRFASVAQARAKPLVNASPENAELPTPQLSRVRLLVSNLN
jgi:hypothetical protein